MTPARAARRPAAPALSFEACPLARMYRMTPGFEP